MSEFSIVVRHVGMARALLERFEELARGPSTAAQAGAALRNIVGDRMSMDGDSDPGEQLRHGEAQQIYPEIWSNLDTARKALRAENVECAAYDRVREGQALVGLLMRDVDGNVEFLGFNTKGANDARTAMNALEAATPVDWAAIKRANELPPEALSLGNKNRVIGVIGFVVAIALIVGLVLFIKSMFASV